MSAGDLAYAYESTSIATTEDHCASVLCSEATASRGTPKHDVIIDQQCSSTRAVVTSY